MESKALASLSSYSFVVGIMRLPQHKDSNVCRFGTTATWISSAELRFVIRKDKDAPKRMTQTEYSETSFWNAKRSGGTPITRINELAVTWYS
jgi:hypothetical protein